MITEQIKNKLYDEYLFKLREEIQIEEFFHVDVEIKEQDSDFCLISTLYAEAGKEIWTDYDSPKEYENPCISCHAWSLTEYSDGDAYDYDDEAEIIILQAINNYRQ